VSADPPPSRIGVIWTPEAQADLRSIDRPLAMEILRCVGRYLVTRTGDVKKFISPRIGFRLRCGDYRIFFRQTGKESITITGVRHRREAYL